MGSNWRDGVIGSGTIFVCGTWRKLGPFAYLRSDVLASNTTKSPKIFLRHDLGRAFGE